MPTSPFGRAFAVFFMYLGIVLLALPISVVGTSFQSEYEKLYPQHDNDDDDDIDDMSTELEERGGTAQARRAERDEIKRSLAELNDKVTLLMDMMTQLQQSGARKSQQDDVIGGIAY